jgi:hypothetical protein
MSQDDMEGETLMASFAKLIKQEDLDYDTRMQRLEAEIRTPVKLQELPLLLVTNRKLVQMQRCLLHSQY